MCLSQVYQMDTGHYLCRNKYYGRGLSIEGFRHALYEFMHNGAKLRRDLFEPILSKLCSLKTVLERQASYRFYSSSLLIIYEGKEPGRAEVSPPLDPPPAPSIDVRMIDFAHSTFKGFRDDQTVHDGPDRGYVFGLESLINILEDIRAESK